jgi:predicted short-subunit dehydrogenase-like oxidoreductase (DUF2520 family)
LQKPNIDKNLNISIIGAGRLGTTVGFAIAEKNHKNIKIVSIATPSQKSIKRAKGIFKDKTKNIIFTNDNAVAAKKANTVFICTPDDLISKVCKNLYKDKTGNGKIIIHFSGSKPLNVLKKAKENGDHIASIHPLKSFASIPEAIKTLKGTEYGITYTDKKGEWATKEIVKLLKGNSIFVKDEAKPIYHAAACIASNYLVTLINHAVYINEKIGIEPQASTRGLLNLIEGTVENIKKIGAKKSLTGPIARGDTGTIKAHIKMFDKIIEKKDMEIYKVMGKKTADLARENEWIDNKTYKRLYELLNKNKSCRKDK